MRTSEGAPKANVGRRQRRPKVSTRAAEGGCHSGIIDFGADIGYFHWGKLLKLLETIKAKQWCYYFFIITIFEFLMAWNAMVADQ